MDYRGHQQSSPPQDPSFLSIESLAKDALLLLQHLEIEKASFWGHSFGVQVLLSAYQKSREAFTNLIMINGFASNPLRYILGHRYAVRAIEAYGEGHKYLPEQMTQFWKTAVMNPLTLKISTLTGGFNLKLSSLRDIEVYSKGVANIDISSFAKLFKEMVHCNLEDVLETIHKPTLLIGGSKDTVTPLTIQKKMAKKIPNSQFVSVPLGSHCTPWDMPELVNLRIEQFLQKL